jgi:hypothetical protein
MDNQLARATSSVPKVFDQRTHAIMDYAAAGTLFIIGLKLRNQRPRASSFAFANAASVLMASALTDYPGGVFRKLSFQMHGLMDVVQASMLAVGPALLGFGREPEAQLFYAQAAMEAGVVAATDWESSSSSPASFA